MEAKIIEKETVQNCEIEIQAKEKIDEDWKKGLVPRKYCQKIKGTLQDC